MIDRPIDLQPWTPATSLFLAVLDLFSVVFGRQKKLAENNLTIKNKWLFSAADN
jgi:hypothetical protein